MNRAYQTLTSENKMTLGLMAPLESYAGSIPSMKDQEQIVKEAEAAGFEALWVRDIPLHDPHFGDAGQMYDPFVYLGYLSAWTDSMMLGIASLILPFRHPIDMAKAINSINNLSQGRLVCGVATGDRAIEYQAYGIEYVRRGHLFRRNLAVMKRLIGESFPYIETETFRIRDADLLPKNRYGKVPFFVTGHSQQNVEWIAQNADGWLYYPQHPTYQAKRIQLWEESLQQQKQGFKPFLQSLYIDLHPNPDFKPVPIHLGYRTGRNYLLEHLELMRDVGVNHVILNFKYAKRHVRDIVEELSLYVLPSFK